MPGREDVAGDIQEGDGKMNLCTAMVRRRVIEDDAKRDGSAVAFQQESIRIAAGLSLPLEAVTQTFAILAMRGVGKTHTASVLAEEFCDARLPFAVLDPTGAWWGLRASADGKGAGYRGYFGLSYELFSRCCMTNASTARI